MGRSAGWGHSGGVLIRGAFQQRLSPIDLAAIFLLPSGRALHCQSGTSACPEQLACSADPDGGAGDEGNFRAKSGVWETCWAVDSVAMDARRLVNHAGNRLALPRTHFACMCLSWCDADGRWGGVRGGATVG